MQCVLTRAPASNAAQVGCQVGASTGVMEPTAPCWPPRGADAPAQWAQAYEDLECELEELRRDNHALIAELRGRRRAQHGSRSERVSPEEMLVGLRKLKEAEPEQVPAGMIEELEVECAERAQRRDARKQQREAKLQRRAEAAARATLSERERTAAKDGSGGGDDDGGDDDDGGGGGGQPRPAGDVEPEAKVIELNAARRNACLRGLAPHDVLLTVEPAQRDCPQCGVERTGAGTQDSHMLDIDVPALKHLRLRQEKLVCAQHPEAGVVTAEPQPRPLAQALPTATLLAFLIVAKIADHLPLERFSDMLARWGGRVAPSTLGDWLHAAAKQLAPVVDRLGEQVRNSTACLQTDGSYARVIDSNRPRGSTDAGLWGYTVAGLGVYFRYTCDGTFADTRAQLGARAGPTITDGHRAYQGQRVPGHKQIEPVVRGVHLNCWAHARRPFEAAYRLDGDMRALPILRTVQRLYHIEAEAKRAKLDPPAIKRLRQTRSAPIVDALFADLERLQAHVTPRSRLGKAIATTLRRKQRLRAYLQNGTWPMDTNLQESQFRGKAIGQHNWLFLGSHAAAPDYAVLASLVRSCKLLGVNPQTYLADVLMRVQQRGSAKNLDALLPAAYARRRLVEAA